MRTLPADRGVGEIAEGVYVTRFGLSFGAGTTIDRLGQVIDDLGEGAVPS